MKLTKTHSALFALLATTALSEAQFQRSAFSFRAASDAFYRQSPTAVNFQGSSFNVALNDGLVFFISPCLSDEYFPPTNIPEFRCPIGANGFISGGFFQDQFGQVAAATGFYFTVAQLNAAVAIDPFAADKIRLIAAPASLLPRPLAGFTASPSQVFFDLQSPIGNLRQFDITEYSFTRNYNAAERGRFDDEIVPGTYTYSFPRLRNPNMGVPLSVTLFPKVDGFRKINNQNTGFRFTNVTWSNGFLVLDPRLSNTITWEGNEPTFIAPALDQVFVSLNRLRNPNDPTSDRLTGTSLNPNTPSGLPLINNAIFPGFLAPQVNEILLPTPLQKQFTLPPLLVFGSGSPSGVFQVRIQTNRPSSGSTGETSERSFQIPVRFIDSFASFVATSLPASATAKDLTASADPDGDGFSNFDEWVFGSDPADPTSAPDAPKLTQTSAGTGIGAKSASEGAWEFKVDKLVNSDPPLEYRIQRSTDMKNWTTISKWDPNWILKDTEAEIKVVSSKPALTGGNFFRAQVAAQ